MEQERSAIRREGQVAEFVQYDGVLVEQAVRQMPGASRALFRIELIHKVDDAVEARPFTLYLPGAHACLPNLTAVRVCDGRHGQLASKSHVALNMFPGRWPILTAYPARESFELQTRPSRSFKRGTGALRGLCLQGSHGRLAVLAEDSWSVNAIND